MSCSNPNSASIFAAEKMIRISFKIESAKQFREWLKQVDQ
jgi:hypothetical protein